MFAFFINTQVFSSMTHRTRALAQMTEKPLRRKAIWEQFQLHRLLLSWISRSQSNLFKYNLKNMSSGSHPVHDCRFLCFWFKFVLTKSTCGLQQPSLHWSWCQLEIQRRNQHQILFSQRCFSSCALICFWKREGVMKCTLSGTIWLNGPINALHLPWAYS